MRTIESIKLYKISFPNNKYYIGQIYNINKRRSNNFTK